MWRLEGHSHQQIDDMIELRFIDKNNLAQLHALHTKQVPRVGDNVQFANLTKGRLLLSQNHDMMVTAVCWRYDLREKTQVVEIFGELV